jgi:hypothetical protein
MVTSRVPPITVVTYDMIAMGGHPQSRLKGK